MDFSFASWRHSKIIRAIGTPVALEPFELALVGRPVARLALAPALQAQFVEQDFAQLLGAADGKGLPRLGVDRRFDPRHFGREFPRQPREIVAVDHDPGIFHALDHRHQRPVNHLIDARAALAGQARFEQLPQPQRDVGILGGIFGGARQRHLGES